MNVASPTTTSFEAYIEAEATSDVKHEWCDGVVYAMSRGTPERARLTARVIQVLGAALEKPCSVYSPDMMIWIEAANLSTYADASVVCGPLQTKIVERNGRRLAEAVTNPTVIVEVLSEGTERYDRDGKFRAYKSLASLAEYVLVHQDEARIEVYRRQPDAWTCETGERGGSVTVHGRRIDVDVVYG
jgi:Uma2 family endonuclease